MALNNNTILKEYFADLAGVSSSGKSFNTGSLNSMLRAWANATAGTSNLSVNSALKLAFATAVGSTQSSLAGLIGDFAGESPNWEASFQSWNLEQRKWNLID